MVETSVHQLVEFLAAISVEQDEEQVLRTAVELASETLRAEIGAVIVSGSVRAAVGFGGAQPPELLAGLEPGTWRGVLGQLGAVTAGVAPMLEPGDRLVVGRLASALGAEERNLLAGMASVLGLGLRTLRTLASERDLRGVQEQLAEERLRSMHSLESRQQLLETLLALQQSISHRAPLGEILEAATEGAGRLLARPVWLVLHQQDDHAGGDSHQVYGPASPGRGEAVRVARVVIEIPPSSARAARVHDRFEGARTYTSATVHVSGTVTGALVAEVAEERTFDDEDERLLGSFAEHISMALTDARTVQAVDDASHDALTDLPNRALFLHRVAEALACAGSHLDEVGVLFIDLDRFKAVNDSLGHAAGDELLKQVAKRLSGSVRHEAVAGRFGGDEFAVLLERGGQSNEASVLAQRIIDRLREPFHLGNSTVVIGASIGIAFGGTTVRDPQDLLRNADLAMFRAKKEGHNGWALFEHQMLEDVRERVELEADLQAAVHERQLRVDYQPVVRLDDGRVVGAQAVTHWEHPARGDVSSSVFVPLAEETGVVVEIGRWSRDEAIRQLARWRRVHADLELFVRISRRQLDDPALISDVAAALSLHDVPPSVLTVTVSEQTLRVGGAGSAEQLRKLKALGVHIAVEDFGTVTSSLGYLRRVPIDMLRIDGSLVEDSGGLERPELLARGVAELGRALGLTSMVVGVESASHLQTLASTACELAQGGFFSGPLRAESFTALLDQQVRASRATGGEWALHALAAPAKARADEPGSVPDALVSPR